MRIGIYAIKDMPALTPLSYDYQFDTNESATFKCCCGSSRCRGRGVRVFVYMYIYILLIPTD